MSLKYRFAVTVFVLEAIMVGVVLWAIFSFSTAYNRSSIEEIERVTLTLLDGLSRTAFLTEEYREIQRFIHPLSEEPHIKSILLSDKSGRIVAATTVSMIGKHYPSLISSENHYWRTVRISAQSEDLGIIAVEFSEDTLVLFQKKMLHRGLSIGLTGMLIIAVAGIVIGHLLTKRLNKLSVIATRVAQGEWDSKFDITGKDEVASLNMAFETMVKELVSRIKDLTESDLRLHKLQMELQHVSRLSAMGELSSEIAHEVNQPLAAIINYVQACRRIIVAEGNHKSNRVYELMEKASAQAIRAGEIIKSVRKYHKKSETTFIKEDLNKVLEEACSLGLLVARDKDIDVNLDLNGNLSPVLIDKIQIQQVVMNLIRNGIEAMSLSEKRELTISTSQYNAENVEVTISDTGVGISEKDLDRIFDPFMTTKNDGMGIGLSISHSIIAAHEGKLWAISNICGGMTFSFTLPVASSVGN